MALASSGTVLYLGLQVDPRSFANEQRRHVSMALLGCQVQRGHAPRGQRVALGAKAQQRRRCFQLLLLGGDVQRSVSVLEEWEESAQP